MLLKERLDKDRQKQESALAKKLGDLKKKRLNQLVRNKFMCILGKFHSSLCNLRQILLRMKLIRICVSVQFACDSSKISYLFGECFYHNMLYFLQKSQQKGEMDKVMKSMETQTDEPIGGMILLFQKNLEKKISRDCCHYKHFKGTQFIF